MFGPITVIYKIMQLNTWFPVTLSTQKLLSFLSSSGNNQKFLYFMTGKALSIYVKKNSLKITLEYIYAKCQSQLFQVLLFFSFALYEMQSKLSYIKIYICNILIMVDLERINISWGSDFSSYEIELQKMTSHHELPTRRFLKKFFFWVTSTTL